MTYRVLGPVEVVAGDRPLAVGPPRQRAVLALLLTEAGRVVPLDRLIELLWAGEPPDQATGTVQVYVSNLRRVLEPDRPPRAPATVLVTQSPGYRLTVQPGQVDAHRFEALVAEARATLAADPSAARARLVEALALWRGPAYADMAGERFAVAEAARLEELRLGALEDRFEAELALGQQLVADVEHHVRSHPLRERPRAQLALALYRGGRQAEALRVIDEGRRLLRDELGLDPGPELVRLEQLVLAHDPSLLAAGPSVPAAVAEAAPEAPLVAPGATLVGREPELARLGRILAEAAAGRGRVVVVSGEGGIGKTALAEAAAGLVRDRGGLVCWGRCLDGEGTPPFWPVVQLVRDLARTLTPAAHEALRPLLARLRDLAPDLLDEPEPSVPLDPELARLQLFDGLVGLLRTPYPGRPDVALLVVDDLHRADPSTLQLLRVAAAEVASQRTVILVTVRPDEAAARPAVADALAALAGSRVVERLDLPPLEPEAVARLVAEGTGLGGDVAAVIYQRSGGNPFFATELAKLLRSGEAQGEDALVAARTSVPSGVRDVLRRRLARLPVPAHRLLGVAAVTGLVFDAEDAAEVAGLGLDEAIDLLDLATASGLVVPESGWEHRFAHSLVVDALVGDLTPARRARWHVQLADAQAGRHGDDPDRWASIAHHYLEGATLAERAKALPWLQRAAEHAVQRAAFEQAEGLYHRLLELQRLVGADPVEQLMSLCRMSFIRFWRDGYDTPTADEFATAAEALAEPDRVSTELVEAWWNAVLLHCQRGRLSRADALLGRLVALVDRSDDPLVAYYAHDMAGVVRLMQGRLADSLAHLDAAAAAAPAAMARSVRLFTFPAGLRVPVISSVALLLAGDAEASASALALARERAEADEMGSAGFVRRWAVLRGLAADDVEGVAELLAPIPEAYDEFRYPAGVLAFAEGWVAARRGAVTAGLDTMRRAVDGLWAIGLRAQLPLLLGRLAEELLAAVHVADADAAVASALAITVDGDRYWRPQLLRLRARLRRRAGDHAAGTADEAEALALAEAQGNRLYLDS